GGGSVQRVVGCSATECTARPDYHNLLWRLRIPGTQGTLLFSNTTCSNTGPGSAGQFLSRTRMSKPCARIESASSSGPLPSGACCGSATKAQQRSAEPSRSPGGCRQL